MSINLSELIWTVICFFVLLFVLKALLFNPLIKFMDERKARIDQGLAEGRQAQQARAENDAMLSDALRQHTAEASRILAEAKDADERERAEALVCAHQEAAQAMQAARKSIRTEQAAAERLHNASRLNRLLHGRVPDGCCSPLLRRRSRQYSLPNGIKVYEAEYSVGVVDKGDTEGACT